MSELDRRTSVEGELAELQLELQGAADNIGKLQEKLGKPLAGFPSSRLRLIAAERLRDEAKLATEQAVAAELRGRIAEKQRELATIEAAERAAFLRGLDAETMAAARVFIPQLEAFMAALEAFREVYWRGKREGVKRWWPVTGVGCSGRPYEWHAELGEYLEKFRGALARAEAGVQDE